jgi:hypothetical protein
VDIPLSYCTIIEQCSVMRFLSTEEVKPADSHRRMLAQYGSVNCMSQRRVYKMVARFKSGRTSVSDETRLEPPSTSRTQDHIDRANAVIREDRQIT